MEERTDTIKRVNVIIVFDKDEKNVLMCKRMKDPYKGKYNLVGGKQNSNEYELVAAYRELEEETGITVEDIRLVELMSTFYSLIDTSLEVYVGILNKDVKLVEEVNPLEWMSVNEDFFDLDKFAGEGNIGHMLEQVKIFRDKLDLNYSFDEDEKGIIYLELGKNYYNLNTEEGFAKAFDYYNKSANCNNSQGMANLGYCYKYGRGTKVDEQQAFAWFNRSASLGNYEAMMKIADYHRFGEIVTLDPTKAFNLYLEIFENIDHEDMLYYYPEIFHRLGECYLYGLGTEEDKESAEYYLSQAVTLYSDHIEDNFYYEELLSEVSDLLNKCTSSFHIS